MGAHPIGTPDPACPKSLVVHAVDNALTAEEVGDEVQIAIHAMPMRPKFRRLLP